MATTMGKENKNYNNNNNNNNTSGQIKGLPSLKQSKAKEEIFY